MKMCRSLVAGAGTEAGLLHQVLWSVEISSGRKHLLPLSKAGRPAASKMLRQFNGWHERQAALIFKGARGVKGMWWRW